MASPELIGPVSLELTELASVALASAELIAPGSVALASDALAVGFVIVLDWGPGPVSAVPELFGAALLVVAALGT